MLHPPILEKIIIHEIAGIALPPSPFGICLK
jgi:hypothetical protein